MDNDEGVSNNGRSQNMIKISECEYYSWQEYFRTTFELTRKYRRIELGRHGDTIKERYIPTDNSDKTEICIGYLEDKLIDWKFENPLTPGFNRQQDLEYFYRYDFTPDKYYGSPGLEFIEMNLLAIDRQLKEGLSGREVQYFKAGQLIKSKVYIDYDGKGSDFYNTIYFTTVSRWRQFINIFWGDKTEPTMATKTIDLSTIFNGLT